MENEKGGCYTVPVVIGALGTVTKNFDKWLEKLELDVTVEMLQRPCLLGTARIIRKVFTLANLYA